jgi:hypothetical protein
MDYSVGLRVAPLNRRGSPIYSACPFSHAVTRIPVVPAIALDDVFIAGSALRRISTGSATTNPTNPDQVGSVTGLQRSLYATAWTDCLSCSGQDFYYRAFLSRVTPKAQVGYHWMVHRHLPSPDFHRLDWQPYGLRPNVA